MSMKPIVVSSSGYVRRWSTELMKDRYNFRSIRKYPEMATDPVVVDLVLAGKQEEAVKYAEEKWPEYKAAKNPYYPDDPPDIDPMSQKKTGKLEVRYIPEGTKYSVGYYSYEYVLEHDKIDWLTIPDNAIIKDGKVAVIIARWSAYSWWDIKLDHPQARLDPELVQLVLDKKFDDLQTKLRELYESTKSFDDKLKTKLKKIYESIQSFEDFEAKCREICYVIDAYDYDKHDVSFDDCNEKNMYVKWISANRKFAVETESDNEYEEYEDEIDWQIA